MARTSGASLGSIETIYRSDFPRFLHVATAITGDVEFDADAVQEGFANAIRHRREFRGDGPLAGWLWRTARGQPRHSATLNAAHGALRLLIEEVSR